ncbi:MAG TPA: molybdopterin-dependent oxidoreductase, partial [Bryobacteraceae bacterium]|nr:molybdopterin-dependent oxidoreductase [Bryobacteraceae bacterium]
SGKTGQMATVADLYTRKAVLVLGADLALEHPLLSFQIRANYRHHQAHVYAVTAEPVREDKYTVASIRIRVPGGAPAGQHDGDLGVIPGRDVGAVSTGPGSAPIGGPGGATGDPTGFVNPDNVAPGPPDYFEALEQLRDRLKAEPELVIVFDDSFQGPNVHRLVEFGESLGIPVRYICLVDYSNSRGALDMGLVPGEGGMRLDQMLAADLSALWVVGANPMKNGVTRKADFLVVQDLFLTETALQADVVLPAASAYEKSGTVTNTTGEVQRLKHAINTMGAKPDLEIMGFIARQMDAAAALGPWVPETVFAEIRRTVHGYDIPLPVIDTGGAALTMPVNGRVSGTPGAVIHSDHNGLFASGTLGRYSKVLNSVLEGRLDR